MKLSTKALLVAFLSMAIGAGAAQAADVNVTSNITTNTTWTAGNVYHLKTHVYVTSGATLTIDPGTLVVSFFGDQGALIITRGSKIFANGTKTNPIIFTSADDAATWTGFAGTINGNGTVVGVGSGTGHVTAVTTYGDPKTGVWRPTSKEWGTLVLEGNGLISASRSGANGADPVTNLESDGVTVRTNTATPTGLNEKTMEGLVAAAPGDQNVLYGGTNDNDSSGALHYVSLRYGGDVLAVGVELNGLSMGGVGRQTVVDHVDIMNCLDDGIETWGGKVQYKYVNIWNFGDDGFDVDEGWRGKLQFGLFVSGYNQASSIGSGISDNGAEIDGAEDSDAQPISTVSIYNCTFIGQPLESTRGGGTAWRDNAHVQYRNSVWMDGGHNLVKFDNADGDNAHGYEFPLGTPFPAGSLGWANTWTTAYTWSTNTGQNTSNILETGPNAHPIAGLYDVQTTGFLNEITNSVFNNYVGTSPFVQSDARGVTSGGATTVGAPYNTVTTSSSLPIMSITRAGAVSVGGVNELRVISLDPRAANEATIAATPVTAADINFLDAPNDGFFTPAHFRGAFSANNCWIKGWTAADAFGFVSSPANPSDPSATIALTSTTSFSTTAGQSYVIESSTDGLTWTPVNTVAGDGTIKKITDYTVFSNAKVYRVTVQ